MRTEQEWRDFVERQPQAPPQRWHKILLNILDDYGAVEEALLLLQDDIASLQDFAQEDRGHHG